MKKVLFVPVVLFFMLGTALSASESIEKTPASNLKGDLWNDLTRERGSVDPVSGLPIEQFQSSKKQCGGLWHDLTKERNDIDPVTGNKILSQCDIE